MIESEQHQASARRAPGFLRNYLWLFILLLLVPVWVVGIGGRSPGGEDTIHWRHDYQAARALAVEADLPLLLDFTADWCPPCVTMNKQVLPDPKVNHAVTRGFIPVKVDLTDRRPGPAAALALRYDVNLIPTFIIVDANGEVLARNSGAMTVSDFLAWLGQAHRPGP